jgi:hypothetical protein
MASVKRLVMMAVLTVLVRSTARADFKVADDQWNGTGRFSGVDYGVSEEFGRAWLVLHYKDGSPCPESDGPCEFDAPVRVQVPGLSYDRSTRRVLLDAGQGSPIVCARVERHTFLGSWETIEPTGNCRYRMADVEQFVDDGYAGHREKRKEIYFGATPGR